MTTAERAEDVARHNRSRALIAAWEKVTGKPIDLYDVEVDQIATAFLAAASPALVCSGCGSTWTDADLADAKRRDPQILSCCPERNMLAASPASGVTEEAEAQAIAWNAFNQSYADYGTRKRACEAAVRAVLALIRGERRD